uniref:carbonic anhydrase n=1 Tax=Anthurium amnicola TaxID=1678845 RepID=A0A1D1YNG9_9ARAE
MKSIFLVNVIALVIFFFSGVNQAAESINFGYVGTAGPNFWHLLSNDSSICETGKNQSPIDVTPDDLKTLANPPNPSFMNAKNVKATNNGNTVEIFSGKEGVPLPAEITVEEEKYTLQQFHFHTPSEHRIDGKHFDAEQHLVFKSESGKISVVAVLYNINEKESKFMVPIIENLPKNVDDKKEIKKVELNRLLCDVKNITRAYSYSGSLTTPPCTEGVTWYVNQDPLPFSVKQFNALRDIIGFNSRFTQVRDGEVIPPPYENPEVPTLKKRKTLYNRSILRK